MFTTERHGTHNTTGKCCGAAPHRTGRTQLRERGDVTVTAVFIVPLVMITMFAIVQYSVAWYAKAALNAAAEDGLRAAQTNDSDDPVAAAQASIDSNARFVSGIVISPTTPAPGQLTVTVTGKVPGAFPGLTLTITGKASGPLETFRTQGYP